MLIREEIIYSNVKQLLCLWMFFFLLIGKTFITFKMSGGQRKMKKKGPWPRCYKRKGPLPSDIFYPS